MDLKSRVATVRAMDEVIRSLNDENKMMTWLMYGVPDGEIDENTKDEDLRWLVESDAGFADLMYWFIRIMNKVSPNGGMWVDGVCSKEED
jgi:hypothetical protein